jgi:Na+/melibiose symporter-like transporter
VIAFIAAFVVSFYPLTNEKLEQIQTDLKARETEQPTAAS